MQWLIKFTDLPISGPFYTRDRVPRPEGRVPHPCVNRPESKNNPDLWILSSHTKRLSTGHLQPWRIADSRTHSAHSMHDALAVSRLIFMYSCLVMAAVYFVRDGWYRVPSTILTCRLSLSYHIQIVFLSFSFKWHLRHPTQCNLFISLMAKNDEYFMFHLKNIIRFFIGLKQENIQSKMFHQHVTIRTK